MAKIAFIGLGVMGYPMAGHIATKGTHDVTVYNRTASKAEKWVAEYGGTSALTPKAAAKGADFVFTCVGNDDDLVSVTTGEEGCFQSLEKGAVLIDNTTASANVARDLFFTCEKIDVGFIDAPVSGGQAGAENGVLTVMCGGNSAVYKKAEPIIMHYARASRLMGGAGSGQLTKMVNQICIAGLVQALSEGMAFAQNANLDTDAVFDVISKGAAGSWQMENRHKTMAKDDFDFGFAVDWMRKDLSICLEEAKSNGSHLPVTALVDQFYSQIQKRGGNRYDTSSLITLLKD